MQKVLVGLCTLFLLTVIFYKYSKDNQQEGNNAGIWNRKGNYRRTECVKCEKKCNTRFPVIGFIGTNQRKWSEDDNKKCFDKCKRECIKREGKKCSVITDKSQCKRLKDCKWRRPIGGGGAIGRAWTSKD